MSENAAIFMNAVPMPLVLIGGDERVIAANEAAQTLLKRKDLVDRHYLTVLRQPEVLDCVEAVLRTGESSEAELPTRDAAGDTLYHLQAKPLITSTLRGVLLSFNDITDMQEASQMRRDFVANVSHELKTPLTALLGFIETLRGPAKDDAKAQERFLGIMEREANRMSRLIQDLLSLSRVEAEARVRPTGQVGLSELVASATMTLGKLAAEQGVALRVTGDEDTVDVLGDADQLLQVVTNLTENGIKYGGSEVAIDVSKVERDHVLRAPAVRLEVKDDGDGIDPLHLPRLTERFYRIDNHRSREMGGTGLGLAIVKHIVNRHRGRLRIDSTPGRGTSIIVVLPVA